MAFTRISGPQIQQFPVIPTTRQRHGRCIRPSAVASELLDRNAPKLKIEPTFKPRRNKIKQLTHTIAAEKLEVFKSLESWADENMLPYLKPVENSWQPQDFLPDPAAEEFYKQLEELRERSREIPDDYFVCLVGDMITEEALPTYQTLLNSFDGVRDETGASPTSWAVWTRAWTAEENRHGDVLNKYLYLSGRVDMKQVEKTIQYLIGSGADIKTENNPYLGFIYTSFQERATAISHGNTGRYAGQFGDDHLARICGTIAADEKRHERAYSALVEKLFEVDPDGTVLALADMMKKKIVMPAHFMYDGRDEQLFQHFSAAAQRVGVYTAADYADIVDFFIRRWNVEKLSDLSPHGCKAQDYLCNLATRLRRVAERAEESDRVKEVVPTTFGWIFDRSILTLQKS